MGVQHLNIKQISAIPVLFGERDVLKTIQLLPGVASAGDGNSGFYVHGGTSDENLILLDEATVYNPSHLLGFFSVFNSDAIKDVTMYEGTMPAQYGGRLSSALDVKMNEGNNQTYVVSGGIGLISSRLNLEGPIKKDKGSFIISARRTYADLFAKLSKDTTINRDQLYFYDINLKANYEINDKNRIYLSGYFGKDVLGITNVSSLNWGNATGTLRWNHLFNSKLFSNTSLVISNYYDNIAVERSSTSLGVVSRIMDYGLKEDLEYFPNSKNTLKLGFNLAHHDIIPGQITTVIDTKPSTDGLINKSSWDNAFYISHLYKPSIKFNLVYGARLSAFTVLGPGMFYSYGADGTPTDSTSYKSGQTVKTYLNIEPRITANFILNENSSIKLSYTRNTQDIHLLNNSTAASPVAQWIPSSNYVSPSIADQGSIGYFKNFNNNMYEFSAEVYYKHIQNEVDYRDNTQIQLHENVESQLLFGQGKAYGIEFLLKKKYGRFNGWISYTLSKSQLQVDGINNGNWYRATQDRPNDLSIVGIYELSKKWTLSYTFVYYSGNPVSFPSGKYAIDNQIYFYYTERNGYRMPSYNRLDFGATYIRKKTEKTESSWTFSIYNVYNRMNAYTITFRQNPDNTSQTQAIQTSLFGIVPSISYNFKF